MSILSCLSVVDAVDDNGDDCLTTLLVVGTSVGSSANKGSTVGWSAATFDCDDDDDDGAVSVAASAAANAFAAASCFRLF